MWQARFLNVPQAPLFLGYMPCIILAAVNMMDPILTMRLCYMAQLILKQGDDLCGPNLITRAF